MPIDHNASSHLCFSRASCVTLVVLFFLGIFSGCGNHQAEIKQANQYLANNQVVQAKRIYRSIVDDVPETPQAIKGLIAVAEIENSTEELIHWSHELLRFRPWDREANVVVGKQYMQNGNYADAVSRFVLAHEESEFKAEKHEIQQLLAKVYQLNLQQKSKQNQQSDDNQP